MKDCEHHEVLLSTWLDGPLEREEQIECLDHLVRCAACRSFYADARALDGLVAVVRAPGTLPTPSPELWTRIESAARGDRAARRGVPLWMRQAAAVLVVALGIGGVLWKTGSSRPPLPDDVVLGRGGSMTEARFVDLAKEVLEADPRYRRAMQRILAQVSRDTGEAGEGSLEEAVDRPDERGAPEGTEADVRRIPA